MINYPILGQQGSSQFFQGASIEKEMGVSGHAGVLGDALLPESRLAAHGMRVDLLLELQEKHHSKLKDLKIDKVCLSGTRAFRGSEKLFR